MREHQSKPRLLITFSLSIAISTLTSFVSTDAMAGYRRCDNTNVCVDEKGYKTYCREERGGGYDGTKTVCVGKGNYRKECISTTKWTDRCVDSKGVISNCKNSGGSISYCDKSNGTKVRCVYYGSHTICTDVDGRGDPI
jgi:hypothetical protein